MLLPVPGRGQNGFFSGDASGPYVQSVLTEKFLRGNGNKEMASQYDPKLLAQLTGTALEEGAWDSLAAKSPKHQSSAAKDERLEDLVARINQLADAPGGQSDNGPSSETVENDSIDLQHGDDEFLPLEPASIRDAGLGDSEVEALILKYLMARGSAAGRDIADQIKLPFVMVDEVLRQLKFDQLIGYKSSAAMNDYICELSDLGRERARRLSQHCTYFGAAPVSLRDYLDSVKSQSLEGQQPSEAELKEAFSDLLINPRMLSKLGPAINSGRGMFLYGFPGNGKTSIAERVTSAFGKTIWIPRAIGIDGEIVRLFDPMNHEEAPPRKSNHLLDDSKVDKRWVRIKRPTIVAGGELTMNSLEIAHNPATGICEAPLQLKSNCGTLVIDDFGRQRMSVDELLNRWIVPLEKRYDFLNLPNGKKIQVPFDQLIVFSTNLEPRDLVDEAFLRRIPYKIEIVDPPESDFRELFRIMCEKLGFEHDEGAIDYLIERHYQQAERDFRACHPRDLLLQVRNHCAYEKQPLALSPEAFDFAVENYFSVM